MKLVKFVDGTYGVRKGWLFYEFLDLASAIQYWWTPRESCFRDCKGSYEQATRALALVSGKHTVVTTCPFPIP